MGDAWIWAQMGQDDPDEEPHDPALDNFAVVPHVAHNEQDVEVPNLGPEPDGGEYDADDEEDPDEDLEDEEPEEGLDEEQDENGDFWLAHAGEDDLVGDNWVNWQPMVFNPAPASIINLVPEEDWHSTFVSDSEDEPVKYELFHDPATVMDPLKKIELSLAKMTEERDTLLKQREIDWDQIAELTVTIAQLQAEKQDLERQCKEAADGMYHALCLRDEQVQNTEKSRQELEQTQEQLKKERAKAKEAQELVATADKAVELLCVRIDQEMCLANRERDLTDEQFQRYVHMLDERRQTRQFNIRSRESHHKEAGEGSSRRTT